LLRQVAAAGLVNELVEAKHKLELRRVMSRWSRYDLIAIDEVGYVPLAEVGAEFLFQVVAQYLWRAVDQDGDVIDILVQPHRDQGLPRNSSAGC
jgi:transposase-like protein